MPSNLPDRYDVLLLPLVHDFLVGVRQRAKWRGSTRGPLLRSELGSWRDKRIVITSPNEFSCDAKSLVIVLQAGIAAHHPRQIVVVGPHLVENEDDSLFSAEVVKEESQEELQDNWVQAACEAAAELGVEITIATVTVDKGWLRQSEQSVARKAGRLFGAAWRQPSSLLSAWRGKQADWEAEERLADALSELLFS